MSVTAAQGFVAAGGHAGVKADGVPDLAVVTTTDGRAVPAAGVFTANKFDGAAGPGVEDAPAAVARAGPRVSSSTRATPTPGRASPGPADAEAMCATVASGLGCDHDEVLVCSTGLIGYRLPMEPLLDAIPTVLAQRSVDGAGDAAQAILTTDTVRKEVVIDGGGFTVGGMAKGAAMLAPEHGDHARRPHHRRGGPSPTSSKRSCGTRSPTPSTASPSTGPPRPTTPSCCWPAGRPVPSSRSPSSCAVTAACASLAEQMVADAEGATKLVRIQVTGARDDAEARTAARAVATSQLTKCSWYGEDPYWGRIASDLGSAGVAFDPVLLCVSYGGTIVCRHGVATDHDEDAVTAHLAQRDITISADLGIGAGRATVLTCDLTHAYVDENRGTS